MSFAVNTFQLNSYAVSCEIITRTLFRLPDTPSATSPAGPSTGEGVINLLTSSHEQIRSDVVAAMRRLAEILGS